MLAICRLLSLRVFFSFHSRRHNFRSNQLSRLYDALEALSVLDNAVIVLASDNGACSSSGGSNYPLRGFKDTTFQGGVRVPAFVYSKSTEHIPEEVHTHLSLSVVLGPWGYSRSVALVC